MTAKKAGGINVAATQKILALLKQRNEEDAALIEELERLVGGGRGIGEILKELEAHWNDLWSIEHRSNYVFVYTEDRPHTKRLYRELGLEEFKARMSNYLKDRGEWLVKNKHPYKAFVRQHNSYASSAIRPEDFPIPVGCTHQPPCQTDQEHTKRKMQEARS